MPKKTPRRTVKQPAKKKTTAGRAAKPAAPAAAQAPAGPVERYGLIELMGKPAAILGEDVKVGQQAPEFTAQANDWSDVNIVAATTGKVRIIAAVPSLSTDVCDRETRRFQQEAVSLDPDILIFVVSADLPPTQRTWCSGAGVDRVQTVSDHMQLEFGEKYGAWIKERRYLRRAVFVVDRDDKITYAAYMHALGIEPNYAEVLAAAKASL